MWWLIKLLRSLPNFLSKGPSNVSRWAVTKKKTKRNIWGICDIWLCSFWSWARFGGYCFWKVLLEGCADTGFVVEIVFTAASRRCLPVDRIINSSDNNKTSQAATEGLLGREASIDPSRENQHRQVSSSQFISSSGRHGQHFASKNISIEWGRKRSMDEDVATNRKWKAKLQEVTDVSGAVPSKGFRWKMGGLLTTDASTGTSATDKKPLGRVERWGRSLRLHTVQWG